MRRSSSFTLIEVIAALLIVAIAFMAIVQAQGGSVRSVLRSEQLSQAMMLAQEKMTELEIAVQKQNLAAFPEEESGEYSDEKLQHYRWTRRLEQAELSCFIPVGDEANQQAGFVQLAERIFEQAIRKAIVRVEWEEGRETRFAELTQLIVRFQEMPQL